jgi:hydroxymethylpyrimidine pyrophosphatase-like HAD family hydrolase
MIPVFANHIACLATDYDGTLARDGLVGRTTLDALSRFRVTGRKLVLVTGRTYDELRAIFPGAEEFDAIVSENGAHLRWPHDRRDEFIGERPPPEFMTLLAQQGVSPLATGHVIVATVEPHQHAMLNAIKSLGLELQVIFNKGAVMALPSGVNKAAGLRRVLKALRIPPENVAAVGDAENDHALFDYCGFPAAVANALPSLKEHASLVLRGENGAGVAELIDLILSSQLHPTRGQASMPR